MIERVIKYSVFADDYVYHTTTKTYTEDEFMELVCKPHEAEYKVKTIYGEDLKEEYEEACRLLNLDPEYLLVNDRSTWIDRYEAFDLLWREENLTY